MTRRSLWLLEQAEIAMSPALRDAYLDRILPAGHGPHERALARESIEIRALRPPLVVWC